MTSTDKRDDLTVDQHLALATAARHLGGEFAGTFGAETIERFLHASYDEFADQSRLPTSCRCWPSASPASGCRPWPRSRARATGGRSCCSCACTTPAAARWRWASSSSWPGNARWPGRAARSSPPRSTPPRWPRWPSAASTSPRVPQAVDRGDRPRRRRRRDDGLRRRLPVFPGKRYVDWEIDDPAGHDRQDIRPIREEIERRVRTLLADLDVATR